MQLNFKVPSACQTVCRKVLTPKEKKHFIKAIDQEYRVHWSVLHSCTCYDMLSLGVSINLDARCTRLPILPRSSYSLDL